MTCASNDEYFAWTDKSPISFDQWKTILSKLTKEEAVKQLSSNSNLHRRSKSRQYSSPIKKSDRQSLPRNQVFTDTVVDSFLISSSTIAPSSIDVPKIVSSPSKRYVSSFKTLVHSTSSKHSQRLSYVNDSVIILKLSKENATENTGSNSQLSSKVSTSSMATSTTPPLKQSSPSPSTLSPILKVEGQKRRTASSEPPLTQTTNIDQSTPINSGHTMAMSTSSQPSSNSSLFPYRTSLTGATTVRQRALAESNTTSLLITTERLKSHITSSMRPARQPLTAATTTTTTTMTSAYISSQPPRNTSQGTRSRVQQDKLTNSKDVYEYPDPFTNCPADILSKLAQLTKLQLETVDWEKKRRFTRKKPITNGTTTQGKDSP